MNNYDVIIVGLGHAGCEAALAASRLGNKTLGITGDFNFVAHMPCNPSIGGPAKGIVVREIDALGGEMGKVADKTQIQMKMLNLKKGPAVRALRAQVDRIEYPKEMFKILDNQENLTLLEGLVSSLIIEDGKFFGVRLEDGQVINSKSIILTTGTYMSSDILVGTERRREGPDGQRSINQLSISLRENGVKTFRLKTGTPPRMEKSTIDFSKTQLQPGDPECRFFSFDDNVEYDPKDQEPCYLTYTSPDTLKVINDNLHRASMYGAIKDIDSKGPRYCPSIEDKVVRFSDKERHQIFLEPESVHYDDIYVQGFSSSMPYEIQDKMVASIIGLEKAKINKYAYAIEYDAIDPTQLMPSLEFKGIEGLFFAGQINGTSGYEEAACQGLMAGINASLKVNDKEPLILKRNEAYIGVLIDDLVTKGTNEPYRLLTSRSEYRLLLRNDNADIRLRDYGYQVGLINQERFNKFEEKKARIDELKEKLNIARLTPKTEVNEYLTKHSISPLKDGISAAALMKRPDVNYKQIIELTGIEDEKYIYEQVEIEIKYKGYIEKTEREVSKMLALENTLIPKDINYNNVNNLALEAREKLESVRPLSIGQASRISGVNPADIAILMVYLKK